MLNTDFDTQIYKSLQSWLYTIINRNNYIQLIHLLFLSSFSFSFLCLLISLSPWLIPTLLHQQSFFLPGRSSLFFDS